MPPARAAGIAATLAAAALWGTSFPVNEAGLDAGIAPATFAAGRFILAALLVLPFLWWLGRLGALRSRWPWLLGLVNAAAFVLQYAGQTIAPAGSSSALVNVNAVTVALLAWWLLGERPHRAVWAGLGIGVAGVLLVASADRVADGGLGGHVLVLGAGAVWAIYFVGVKRAATRGEDPFALAAGTFVATGAVLFPALVLAPPPAATFPLAAIAYTGVACTLGAFGLWMWGLQAVGAATSAVALLLEVAVASLLGWAVLGEPFPALKLVGVLMVVSGALAVSLPPASTKTPHGAAVAGAVPGAPPPPP